MTPTLVDAPAPGPATFGVRSPAAAVRRSAVNPVVRAALYLFVTSIPFEMPNRPLPIEVPTLTGCVLLAASLLEPRACFRRVPAAFVAFVAYLWVLAAGAVVNGVHYGPELLKAFADLSELCLVLWVAFNLFADERTVRGALLAFGLACAARAGLQVLGIAVTTLPVYASPMASAPSAYQVTVLGQNPNLTAMILSGGVLTLIGLASGPDRRFRRMGAVAWALSAVVGLALIQGGSRGGLLCALVGLAVLAWGRQGARNRLRNGGIALLAAGVLAWGAYASPMMRQRLEQTESGQLSGRTQIYSLLMDMIRERPLLGWGVVANHYELGRRLDDPRYVSRDPHNLLLELLTGEGLLGSLPFVVAVLFCWAGAWRARAGPLGLLPLAFLAAQQTGTMSGTWIESKILWFAFALALAAGAHWAAPDPGAEAVG